MKSRFLGSLLVILLVGGCTTMWQQMAGNTMRKGVSSSLVDFLYPKGEEPPPVTREIPHLTIPLKVGLAFVPSADGDTPGLSEAHKANLLGRTRAAFLDREFIREIVVIPETYLRSKNGFDSIDQVSRLYGLDVIALVSFDQVVNSADTRASLLYWTIVGAYLIKGSKNDVQTFVDTAIFDVRTHSLLFRAPGIDVMQATSTLIKSVDAMRSGREKSFSNAMADMSRNLAIELDAFRERIKQDKSVKITRSNPAAGRGGSLDALALLLASLGWRRSGRGKTGGLPPA